jgi:serine palmitoyltransferase
LYDRIIDVFNRPICSSPSAWITVQERAPHPETSELIRTGVERRCMNLGSYNYLGFADDWMNTCGEPVLQAAQDWPTSTGGTRTGVGTTPLHRRLEAKVAQFVGKEDAVVFNMGYGTNSTTVPALVGRGDLIVSDELNHSSIVAGCRASGAMIRSFKHNDAKALENVLREAIAYGRPRTRRPWRKILVMVEGIYSMEGEICDLKEVARVTKKYKAYLYLDEAHSIGALGLSGRGCCEHCGVDPKDVDILMGTFTKSFGGMGGYVASSKAVVDHLRRTCPGVLAHDAMSPIMCAQVLRALDIVSGTVKGDLGRQKIDQLKANSNYFRSELQGFGLHVYGDWDSPIVPVLLYNPTKIAAFSRECFDRGLAVVVVGFPATTLVKSRARFCVSAGHSREDLDDALRKIKEVAELIKIRYAVSHFG